MLRRYREMDIHLAGVILGVHGAFGQMFLHLKPSAESVHRFLIIRRKELVQILKHTASSAGGRYEFYDFLVFSQISVPSIHIRSLFLFRYYHNTFFYRSGGRYLKERETFYEASELLFNLFFADSFGFQLF